MPQTSLSVRYRTQRLSNLLGARLRRDYEFQRVKALDKHGYKGNLFAHTRCIEVGFYQGAYDSMGGVTTSTIQFSTTQQISADDLAFSCDGD